MLRGATALVAAFVCLLAAAAPAGAASNSDLLSFEVSGGSLSEVVTFQGDGGAACARAGVCGYSGTISYGFPGIRDGQGTVVVSRRGKRSSAFGFATLDVGGLTSASITGAAGGTPCTERILHKFDGFALEGNARTLRILIHPAEAAPDYLASFCGGPSDADVAHAGMLPAITIPTRKLRQRRLTLAADSTRRFHIGPFVGTVAVKATFVLKRVSLPQELLNLLTGG